MIKKIKNYYNQLSFSKKLLTWIIVIVYIWIISIISNMIMFAGEYGLILSMITILIFAIIPICLFFVPVAKKQFKKNTKFISNIKKMNVEFKKDMKRKKGDQ